ncbi:MAG: beta-lactamase family protein [Actinomycetia bacterium]|nr:beta-lactamase family protein [Actinomycetes bacterium]
MTGSAPSPVGIGPDLAGALERRARQSQRDWRAPGLIAGVVRDGSLVWSCGVGAADLSVPERALGADTAFAIGSVTKTFTASLIMMLRDAGRLSLADRLDAHLPGVPHGAVTLREMLAHASGLQREPAGQAWDELAMPSIEELLAHLDQAEQVLPARRRWHYSNLAFALLGEVVARVEGRPWADALRARLLEPLGMTATTLAPPVGRAVGYYADPFADRAQVEPWPDMAAFCSAGGLWSTLSDLGRWASFLATGADGVLSADTLEEMSRPEIMVDLDGWTEAWGLGLELFRSGERVMVGHGGAMPGFLTGLAVRRRERVGAIVAVNSSAGADPAALAVELVGAMLDREPPPVPPWRPGPPVPAALEPLLGQWWSEGSPFTFSVRQGHLEARADAAPDKAPAVFEQVAEDRFRVRSGREEGELLFVERGPDGAVTRMFWAGSAVTHHPQAFG